MIKIGQRRQKPQSLQRKCVKRFKQHLRERVARGEKIKSEEFRPYWSEKDVKKALWKMHNDGKCCYCERKRDPKREPDVEHFRPKAAVAKTPEHSGYWWLAYEWSNYLFSCKTCNQEYKDNEFPLLNKESRAYVEEDKLEEENPCLINPVEENPEDFITYEWEKTEGQLVKAFGVDDPNRGNETIRIVGLNRQLLMQDRAEIIYDLQAMDMEMKAGLHMGNKVIIRRAKKRIRDATSSKRTFAGFRRAFFRSANLGEYIAND